jgi:importin subunit beta-1
MFDYVVSLREGIMDAWGGIIGAMKADGKGRYSDHNNEHSANHAVAHLLQPYVETIFQLLNTVYLDPNRSEGLLRSSMGVIG